MHTPPRNQKIIAWIKKATLLLSALLLLGGVPALAQTSHAITPGNHHFTYKAFLGGFELGTINSHFGITGNSYRIEHRIAPSGFMSSLLDFDGTFTTEGAYTTEGFTPKRLIGEGLWLGDKYTSKVDFNGASVRGYSYFPDDKRFKAEEYLGDALTDVTDPSTVILTIASNLVRGDGCDLNERMFTGRMLTDITISEDGRAPLPKNHFGLTGNDVRKCIGTGIGVAKIRKKVQKKRQPLIASLYIDDQHPEVPPHPLLIESKVRGMVLRIWMTNYRFES